MNYYNRKNYDREFDECNENEIKELLLYHKVTKVSEDTLVLDNGTELTIEANVGCGGCSSGWYEITELNDCDNVITNVELICGDANPDDSYSEEKSYKIFVYAEDKHIKLLQVDGSDGNGYYGTGYTIYVKYNKTK
jgi:hypothetical protein